MSDIPNDEELEIPFYDKSDLPRIEVIPRRPEDAEKARKIEQLLNFESRCAAWWEIRFGKSWLRKLKDAVINWICP